ncbi:hypothetical protein U3516DRAFT_745441 [Neocallimastix sp. 'constans']
MFDPLGLSELKIDHKLYHGGHSYILDGIQNKDAEIEQELLDMKPSNINLRRKHKASSFKVEIERAEEELAANATETHKNEIPVWSSFDEWEEFEALLSSKLKKTVGSAFPFEDRIGCFRMLLYGNADAVVPVRTVNHTPHINI